MATASSLRAIRGHVFAFRDDPFRVGVDAAVLSIADGVAVIEDGLIRDVGEAADTIARYPGLAVDHYPGHLVMAGFVDSHVHYPQLEIIASYGEQLLEWLNKYTFPAECQFGSPAYARSAANVFLDTCLANGITTSSVYCTTHPASVDAFFEASLERGMRMCAGKVMMDRNGPDALIDTPERGFSESEALIKRWHGRGRAVYVVTPRFAPTSTAAQLEAAGALWKAYPTTLMQTHISESVYEIEWVRDLYPEAQDYLDVYERFGLIGPGSNFGHAIHLTEREVARLVETGSAVSHCPTSNTFIGSGLFDMQTLRDCNAPITVGLATDIGGGSSMSMFHTMKASYEICQLQGYSLHPAKAFYLATLGSAEALRLGKTVGNLAPGYEADVIVIDLKSRPLIKHRMKTVKDLWEALFVQIVLADDRAIRATYIAGEKAYDRGERLTS